MGELQIEGGELKKLVKLARTKSMAFAFCPGAGEQEAMFCIHRRKKPELIGKGLRKESGQSKVAYGRLEADGKTLNLSCDRSIPGMEKKLKTYLRAQKLPVKIVVLDADGQEI